MIKPVVRVAPSEDIESIATKALRKLRLIGETELAERLEVQFESFSYEKNKTRSILLRYVSIVELDE